MTYADRDTVAAAIVKVRHLGRTGSLRLRIAQQNSDAMYSAVVTRFASGSLTRTLHQITNTERIPTRCTMSASWTRTRPLTAKQVDSALPRWGPNGHRILYIRAARRGLNDTDLMVMGARGRHNRVLLPGQGRNIIDDLAWAPGGLRVVLVMTRLSADQDYVDDADLWVYTPRTRRLRKLNALPGRMVTSVDWSRAGIVFSAFDFYGEPRGKADLYAIRPNGSGLRQVTNTPTRHEERPRFSPDGLRLVYTAAAGRCRTLIVTNAGGRNPRRTGVGCNARGASWSPDSRRLLAQLRTRRQEMWDIRVDGSDKRFIAPGAQGSWRPR